MAQKIEVTLVDDLTGEEADETVRFALDGVEVEVDLTTANADELRAALSRFVAAGRRGGVRKGLSGRAGAKRDDLTKIRQWGRENGYEVSDRGRVAETVKAAYDKAHSVRVQAAA